VRAQWRQSSGRFVVAGGAAGAAGSGSGPGPGSAAAAAGTAAGGGGGAAAASAAAGVVAEEEDAPSTAGAAVAVAVAVAAHACRCFWLVRAAGWSRASARSAVVLYILILENETLHDYEELGDWQLAQGMRAQSVAVRYRCKQV